MNTFCAPTSVKLLTDKFSGRSKGLAFVKFDDEEEMNKAIANNKCDHMGRYLIIEQAYAQGSDPAARNIDTTSATIFVGNLSF
jgi:hypothetical protein